MVKVIGIMIVRTKMKLITDKRMTSIGLIKFYENLVRDGKLLVGSAGHRRLTELKHKREQFNRLKKYGKKGRTAE